MKKFLLILFSVVVVVIVTVVSLQIFISNQRNQQALVIDKNIASFVDCAKAGYPIMETYPEQCRTKDGRTFVKPIPNPEIIAGVESLQYSDSEFGFSFWYPAGAEVRKENLEGYLSLAKAGLAGIFLPQELFVGTNLGEAAVIVGISTSPDAVSKCEQINTTNDEKDLGPAMIGFASGHKFSAVGVGAGNIYESTIYRLVKNQNCYEIVELLHSGNIYNYDPGTVEEFDKNKFLGILEKMVQSFVFSN